MKPLILTAASVGNKWTKTDSPYIPLTPEEIAEDGIAAVSYGAAMLHIHARDENGKGTCDPKWYQPQFEAYRRKCPDVILQLSVGIVNGRARQYLEPMLQLRPDFASLNIKGNPDELLFACDMFNKYGVKPVIECFNMDNLQTAKELVTKGILKPPLFFEIVFEIIDQGTCFMDMAQTLLGYIKKMPTGSVWSQTGGAKNQFRMQTLAASLGGHIRAGIEDSLYTASGQLARSSAELIKRAGEIGKFMGRRIATPEQARQILGLLK